MEILLLIYLLMLYIIYKTITHDIFSPVYPITLILFSFVSALLFQNKIYNCYHINLYDSLILFSILLILFIPTILVSKICNNNTNISIHFKLSKFSTSIILILYLVFFILYIYIEFYSSGVYCPLCHMLNGDIRDLGIEKIHRYGKDSKLQLFIAQLPMLSLFIIYIYKGTKNRIKKGIYLIMILIIPLLGLIKTSKSDIIFPLLSYMMVWYYLSNKKYLARRYIVSFGFIIILIGLYLTFLRVNSAGGIYSTLIDYNTDQDLTKYAPYLFGYTSASIINFFRYLNITDYSIFGNHIGLSFFRPIYTLLLQGNLFDELNLNLNYIGPGATVGTYLRVLYIEGGLSMVYIASFIYAFLISGVYFMLNKKKSFFWVLIYTILYIPWAMLFFQNLYANLNIWFSVVLVIFIYAIENETSNQRR